MKRESDCVATILQKTQHNLNINVSLLGSWFAYFVTDSDPCVVFKLSALSQDNSKLPFSPTKGKDHVKTSMKLGSQ